MGGLVALTGEMRGAALCVVALCLASAAALEGIEEDMPCTPLQTCGECAFSHSCGWCDNIQTCLNGDVEGPEDGNCTQWSYNFCSGESCGGYAAYGCAACIMDPFCGFCAEGQECMEGSKEGPLIDSCPPGLWFKDSCNVPEDSLTQAPRPKWHTYTPPVIIDVDSTLKYDGNTLPLPNVTVSDDADDN